MKTYDTAEKVSVCHWKNGQKVLRDDTVAEEVPVALVYNGISHAVMLATPADLEDFALGFSLTEGIIEVQEEIYGTEIVEVENGIRVEMDIASERFQYLKERRRNLTGRTGCGLCGTDSLSQAVRMPPLVMSNPVFSTEVIHWGFEKMDELQLLKKKTGATHAAAWLDANGNVGLVREDVGRHNALDKLIGALVRQKADRSTGAALVTSRASYEMVQKCGSAGIGMLAAVSAPTALAIQIANEINLTLLGFVRENGHTVYAHPQRLV